MAIELDASLNVFGTPLEPCGAGDATGFFRDGCCNTNKDDIGSHTICVAVTTAFLEYSRFQGNDLSTPVSDYGFPGLKDGDRWCLCAQRWLDAYEQKMAPPVYLSRTHLKALDTIPLAVLKEFAIDLI